MSCQYCPHCQEKRAERAAGIARPPGKGKTPAPVGWHYQAEFLDLYDLPYGHLKELAKAGIVQRSSTTTVRGARGPVWCKVKDARRFKQWCERHVHNRRRADPPRGRELKLLIGVVWSLGISGCTHKRILELAPLFKVSLRYLQYAMKQAVAFDEAYCSPAKSDELVDEPFELSQKGPGP